MNKDNRLAFKRAVFAPRAMGWLVLSVIALAFAGGLVFKEIALVLAGAVFLTIWFYCLLMILLLALLHRHRARQASIQISPAQVPAGDFAEAMYCEKRGAAAVHVPAARVLQLPGILVRCRLLIETKDGRRISYDFSPSKPGPHIFPVKKRGAYFCVWDEFAVFDALGFFCFAFRLQQEGANLDGSGTSPRLLAKPNMAETATGVHARAGDSSLTPELSLQRSDILIDHRPYTPGDDPRRINWKLYGHGGNLFVREGEREPPPHSALAVLVDGEYDPALYDKPNARHGVDLLCENALAVAVACSESGMDVVVGTLDGGGDRKEFAATLARPSATCVKENQAGHNLSGTDNDSELSLQAGDTDNNRGIMIFALPRSCTETNLDRFLKKAATGQGTGKNRNVDLLFVCHQTETGSEKEDERITTANLCVSMFNQRPGVKARLILV